MAQSNTAEIVLTGKDEKLINALKHSEAQVKSFGTKTIATFNHVGRSIRSFSDRYIGALAGLGVTLGAAEVTKDMMEFDGMLRRIGRTGGYSGQQLQGLRADIMNLIGTPIPLTKGDWGEVASALHNAGVELKVIRDIMPQVGKGAVASRTAPGVYAEAMADFIMKYRVAARDLPALQEQLNAAMKWEDVRKNPEGFLQSFSGLAKTMQLIGAQGKENVTPLIAAMGQLAVVTGSPEGAAGSMEALLNGTFRLAKRHEVLKQLSREGINFFDAKGKIKPLNQLLEEYKKVGDVAARHGKDIDAIAMTIFGRPEAGKAIMTIVKYYEEIKAKQAALQSSSGTLGRDFITETTAMSSKLKEFMNQIDRFKMDHMGAALRGITKVLDELNAHPLIAKGLIVGLLGAGGVIVLEKVIGAFGRLGGFMKGVKDIWSGGKGGGKGGMGEALAKTGGAIPVYVTNWGGGAPGAGVSGQRTAETATGTALGKSLAQYGVSAYAGLQALGVGAASTLGGLITATLVALIGNEVNREKLGDQGMIDIMRRRSGQSSAAGRAMENEFNFHLHFEGDRPKRVWVEPTDLNSKINMLSHGRF
jgi:TP901 family phage tail tape measure protein